MGFCGKDSGVSYLAGIYSDNEKTGAGNISEKFICKDSLKTYIISGRLADGNFYCIDSKGKNRQGRCATAISRNRGTPSLGASNPVTTSKGRRRKDHVYQ